MDAAAFVEHVLVLTEDETDEGDAAAADAARAYRDQTGANPVLVLLMELGPARSADYVGVFEALVPRLPVAWCGEPKLLQTMLDHLASLHAVSGKTHAASLHVRDAKALKALFKRSAKAARAARAKEKTPQAPCVPAPKAKISEAQRAAKAEERALRRIERLNDRLYEETLSSTPTPTAADGGGCAEADFLGCSPGHEARRAEWCAINERIEAMRARADAMAATGAE
jgi:hypothetical protein